MTVRLEQWLVGAALLLVSAAAGAGVLTGTVRSEGAQPIIAPPSLSSPVTLQFFVPDGTQVKKGDPVLRIDASSASAQLETLQDKITLSKATQAKQLAALQLKMIDAELALEQARAALGKAKVDAGIPKQVITALDYDTYQGAYESAKRDTSLKNKQLTAARAAVARQRTDGDLQLRKLELELAFYKAQVESATVHAQRDGVVVHGFQHMRIMFAGGGGSSADGRFQEGSTTFPGTEVGQIVGSAHHFTVRAWALQPDRRNLKVGQTVRVHFDALPRSDVGGHITAISAAAQSRSEWGDGQYYQVDVALDVTAGKLGLLPGMSARVQTDAKADHVPVKAASVVRKTLHATGEVLALNTWAAIPPRIRGLWRMTITRMAPGGSKVRKGQPLVTFAAGSLAQQLPAQQSQLAEAKRSREQLRLQMADDQRTAKLAVAKAKADADKARRKAGQPKQYVPAIEYQKIVIDHDSTVKILALTKQRAVVAVASRKAQLAEADAKVVQAQRKVRRMQKSMGSLTIRAPRSGLFLHRLKRDGTRVDVGDQVFFGSPVGNMPDMDSLAVSAALPERDLQKVHVGQSVQVILSGGSARTLAGHISSIGQNVHSKSSAESVPVVNIQITLDEKQTDIKPGRSVRVDIPPVKGAST